MRTILKPLAATALAAASWGAAAHEGHGLPGASHWHATDLPLFLVAAAAVVAATAWWGGRK